MKIIEIDGGNKLRGTIRVSGAKNATVALIPAAILTDEEATICNVPEITDTDDLCDILENLKVNVKRASESIIINPSNMENIEITEKFSKRLRASYYFMGALLGKYGKASMYFPGGCSIGSRPIDLHLKGFEALGAKVTIDKETPYLVPRLINDIPNNKIKIFNKYFKRINLSVREKISEIRYEPNPYDKDRFLLYMDDGNSVYLTITKFERLNYYNDVLSQLEGKKGILYLDSGNHFQVME